MRLWTVLTLKRSRSRYPQDRLIVGPRAINAYNLDTGFLSACPPSLAGSTFKAAEPELESTHLPRLV
jgi:hypothetical protein